MCGKQVKFLLILVFFHVTLSAALTIQKCEDGKVEVVEFMESLCPGCIASVKNNLLQTVKKIPEHVNIRILPYGNAYTDGHNVRCQHGEMECYGNRMMSCVIEKEPDQTRHIPILACLLGHKDFDTTIRQCYKENAEEMIKCAGSQHSLDIMIKNGEETKKAGIDYVPALLVNGQHNEAAENNLLAEVCRILGNEPAGCKFLESEEMSTAFLG